MGEEALLPTLVPLLATLIPFEPPFIEISPVVDRISVFCINIP